MSSSTITYTSISSNSDLPPWGFYLMDLDEFEAPQSLEQAPPSPDYVPGPEYPEYVAPSDDEIPIEDQPLPADASPPPYHQAMLLTLILWRRSQRRTLRRIPLNILLMEEMRKRRRMTVATKSGLVPVNAAKQSSPRVAASISTARHVNTAALKQKKLVVVLLRAIRENAVNRHQACWIWSTNRGKVIDHISNASGNSTIALQDQGIFDSDHALGYGLGTSPPYRLSRHLMVDLLHLQEVLKEVKLLEKVKLGLGKLDFEDVYFVKKLKFNLFSFSQMCDKKNSVLFTVT
ncbi:hypothetical protein Tco_1327689 [Tanacetum coccineum]